jgi:hypothetical protein
MRKLLTWIVVTLGIAALVRRLRRRGRENELSTPTETGGEPADELRRKLAESRTEEEPSAAGEPAASPEATVEERRTSVHEEGRAALDEMSSHDES